MLTWILSFVLMVLSPDLETGKDLRQKGQLDEAIAHFEQLLSSEPDSLDARRELGHTLVLAGRYREALETYERLGASTEARWQLESAKWMGLTYLYLGRIEESLSEHDRQIRIARQLNDRAAEVHAMWYRGHLYTELGRFGEANEAFLEALETVPDDLNSLHLAAFMAARQGDEGSLRYQIEDLEKAVRDSGEPSQMRRVQHLRAELALIHGQPKRALTNAQEANEFYPHPLYRDTMARAHLRLDDTAAAESTYRDILDATDERLDIPLYYVKALLGLARTLDTQEKEEEAASTYQKFLAHWGDAPGDLPGVAEARERVSGSTR
jgi:tetratricopeptide (TPR) repeat protein